MSKASTSSPLPITPKQDDLKNCSCCDKHRPHRTIWEVRLAEVQVVAGPGGVVLRAHGELHALDVLLEVVERAEDVLHPLHAHAVHAVVGQRLVSLHLGVAPALAGLLHGQRLDDVARWALQRGGLKVKNVYGSSFTIESVKCFFEDHLFELKDNKRATYGGSGWSDQSSVSLLTS